MISISQLFWVIFTEAKDRCFKRIFDICLVSSIIPSSFRLFLSRINSWIWLLAAKSQISRIAKGPIYSPVIFILCPEIALDSLFINNASCLSFLFEWDSINLDVYILYPKDSGVDTLSTMSKADVILIWWEELGRVVFWTLADWGTIRGDTSVKWLFLLGSSVWQRSGFVGVANAGLVRSKQS